MSAAARIPIADQIAGVEFAREKLAAEMARGLSAANAGEIARMHQALGQIEAALTTLRWLARDREGCIGLLTTRAAPRVAS